MTAYSSVPSPPVAAGSVTLDIAVPFVRVMLAWVVENDGLESEPEKLQPAACGEVPLSPSTSVTVMLTKAELGPVASTVPEMSPVALSMDKPLVRLLAE